MSAAEHDQLTYLLSTEIPQLEAALAAAREQAQTLREALRQIDVAGRVRTGSHNDPETATTDPRLENLAEIARVALDATGGQQ